LRGESVRVDIIQFSPKRSSLEGSTRGLFAVTPGNLSSKFESSSFVGHPQQTKAPSRQFTSCSASWLLKRSSHKKRNRKESRTRRCPVSESQTSQQSDLESLVISTLEAPKITAPLPARNLAPRLLRNAGEVLGLHEDI